MGQVHDTIITSTPATALRNADGQTIAEAVNKRKLVTVRKIDALNPIEGADAIEVATIDGWKVVTKKGEFKVGDPCVYFEIDSFLPAGNPAWQFLVDKSSREFEGVVGHRLRTIKLRGQISQGLVLPLIAFPEIQAVGASLPSEYPPSAIFTHIASLDFSALLGIKKWEAPLPAQLAGQSEGYFPIFIRKTDQERCQNLKGEIFGYDAVKVKLDLTPEQAADGIAAGRLVVEDGVVFSLSPAKADRDARYEISMKLDGSSTTPFIRKDENGEVKLGICSRNLQLKINDENKDNSFVKILFDSRMNVALEKFYARTGRSIALQGELMGPGIQGNRENFKEARFFLFDIFDIDAGEYLGPGERMEIFDELRADCVPSLFGHVPVLHRAATLQELGLISIDDLLKFAEGPSIAHAIREGLVFKRMDGKFSFKAISNLFLAKEKD